MEKQGPNIKPRALVQSWLEPEYVERAKRLPHFHRGLIAHMARTGYIKELEKAEKDAQEQERKAS
jgi:hypothetical protein